MDKPVRWAEVSLFWKCVWRACREDFRGLRAKHVRQRAFGAAIGAVVGALQPLNSAWQTRADVPASPPVPWWALAWPPVAGAALGFALVIIGLFLYACWRAAPRYAIHLDNKRERAEFDLMEERRRVEEQAIATRRTPIAIAEIESRRLLKILPVGDARARHNHANGVHIEILVKCRAIADKGADLAFEIIARSEAGLPWDQGQLRAQARIRIPKGDELSLNGPEPVECVIERTLDTRRFGITPAEAASLLKKHGIDLRIQNKRYPHLCEMTIPHFKPDGDTAILTAPTIPDADSRPSSVAP